jgi:hypothetical protein
MFDASFVLVLAPALCWPRQNACLNNITANAAEIVGILQF